VRITIEFGSPDQRAASSPYRPTCISPLIAFTDEKVVDFGINATGSAPEFGQKTARYMPFSRMAPPIEVLPPRFEAPESKFERKSAVGPFIRQTAAFETPPTVAMPTTSLALTPSAIDSVAPGGCKMYARH
jgi:hypothetical protein